MARVVKSTDLHQSGWVFRPLPTLRLDPLGCDSDRCFCLGWHTCHQRHGENVVYDFRLLNGASDFLAQVCRLGFTDRGSFLYPTSFLLINGVSAGQEMASPKSIPKGLKPLAGGGVGELQRGNRNRRNKSPPDPKAAAEWRLRRHSAAARQ